MSLGLRCTPAAVLPCLRLLSDAGFLFDGAHEGTQVKSF